MIELLYNDDKISIGVSINKDASIAELYNGVVALARGIGYTEGTLDEWFPLQEKAMQDIYYDASNHT